MPNRCSICGKDVIVDPSVPLGDAPCPHCGNLLWFTADSRPILDLLVAELGFVGRQVVLPDLKAKKKNDAIRALVKGLVAVSEIASADEDSVVDALLRREELGSTGIGQGLAIPHAKHPAVSRIVGAVGRSREGIDFDSLDREPVHTLVLLVSPRDLPGDHLRAVERISRLLRT